MQLPSALVSSSSYNPFDGPNENPEAELPLAAGKYLYVYGDMDEDGFYEGLSERGGRAGGARGRSAQQTDLSGVWSASQVPRLPPGARLLL